MILVKIEKLVLAIAPWIAGPAVFASLAAIFFWVPTDAGLGVSQRIFYYHVPCAVTCFVAFVVAGVSSGIFLKTGKSEWDHSAYAGVSVGMLFATLVLATGSTWARTAWGTWWTWDARLTTFLVLWLLFSGYLLMRSFARDNDLVPRYAAVLAIAGALNIPLVQFATRLWRTIHPQVINNPKGGIDDPRMVAALALSFVSVLSIFACFWALRLRTLRLEERINLIVGERTAQGTLS